jgi:hypothetical protein
VCRVDLGPGCGDHAAVPEPLAPTSGCDSYASRDVVIAAQARAIEELTAANARLNGFCPKTYRKLIPPHPDNLTVPSRTAVGLMASSAGHEAVQKYLGCTYFFGGRSALLLPSISYYRPRRGRETVGIMMTQSTPRAPLPGNRVVVHQEPMPGLEPNVTVQLSCSVLAPAVTCPAAVCLADYGLGRGKWGETPALSHWFGRH